MTTVSGLRHWVEIRRPAYDCHIVPCKWDIDTCKNGENTHGKSSVEMAWYTGKSLAFDNNVEHIAIVQFILLTGWHLNGNMSEAMAMDLGVHSPHPLWDGHESSKCQFASRCYYDGSGLNAEDPWMILRKEGDEALWAFLDNYWKETFG